jgi:hypothetical protein
MWSKKLCLKRNISCDTHLLNQLLETDIEVACLEMTPSWCQQVNWGTVGFPEWTAQFSVWKTTGKDSSEACAIACQKCAVYSVFPSGMTPHSKIAQFNWECIGRLRQRSVRTDCTEMCSTCYTLGWYSLANKCRPVIYFQWYKSGR